MALDFVIQTGNKIVSAVMASPLFTVFTKGNTLRNVRNETALILGNESLLTPRQKIIPATGVILAGSATLLALSSLMFTLPAWVPSIVILTLLGGIGYDLAFYLEERFERQSLRSKFITKFDLQSQINEVATLTRVQKLQLQDYSFGHADILAGLYQLRIEIISFQDRGMKSKRELIGLLNKFIENIIQDKCDSTDVLKKIQKKIPKLAHDVELITKGILRYKCALADIKTIKISPVLITTINNFRETQRKIFTQDLILEDKEQLVKLLEGKMIDTNQMLLLLSKIATRFVSHTSHWQVQIQDDHLNHYLLSLLENDDVKTLVRFYQTPRKVSHQLHKIIQWVKANKQIPTEKRKEYLDELLSLNQLLSDPIQSDALSTQWKKVVKLMKGVQTPHPKKVMLNIFSEIATNYNAFQEVFEKLKAKDGDNALKLHDLVIAHRTTTLEQYLFGLDHEFNLPKTQFDKPVSDIISQVETEFHNTVVGKELVKLQEAVDSELNEWIKTLKKALYNEEVEVADKAVKDKLYAKFKAHYGNAIVVIQSAQRLKYLEQAAPRHCLNVGFDISSGLLSVLLNCSIPPTVMVSVLTYLNQLIPGFSAVNGLELAYRKSNTESTLTQGIIDLSQGIVPQWTAKQKEATAKNDKIIPEVNIRLTAAMK